MLDDHRDFERNLRRVLVNLPGFDSRSSITPATWSARFPKSPTTGIDAIRFAYGLLASTTGSND